MRIISGRKIAPTPEPAHARLRPLPARRGEATDPAAQDGDGPMKAVVLREHGDGGSALRDRLPRPGAGRGRRGGARRAPSLNYHDVFTRRGMPGIRIPMPAIMGLDVAGEIAALGPGVCGWKIGDRVLGDPINRIEGGLTGETVHGGLAEYCRLRAHQLVPHPDGASFVAAAALPCAYGTARG